MLRAAYRIRIPLIRTFAQSTSYQIYPPICSSVRIHAYPRISHRQIACHCTHGLKSNTCDLTQLAACASRQHAFMPAMRQALSQKPASPLALCTHARQDSQLGRLSKRANQKKSGKACAARVSRLSNRHMQANGSAAHAASPPPAASASAQPQRSPPTPSNTTGCRRAFFGGNGMCVITACSRKAHVAATGSCALLPCHKQHRPTCAMQCTAQPSATPRSVCRLLPACAKPPLHARQAGYARSLQSFFHLMKTKCVRHYQKLLAKYSPSFF